MQVLRAEGVEFSPGFGIISLKESRLLGWFFIDLFCLLPQPMPFIHFTLHIGDVEGKTMTEYTADGILMTLMFLRLIYLPRFVAEVSILKQDLAVSIAPRAPPHSCAGTTAHRCPFKCSLPLSASQHTTASLNTRYDFKVPLGGLALIPPSPPNLSKRSSAWRGFTTWTSTRGSS